MQMIQSTRSADDVLTAYDHLLEASYLLGTIPPWSSYHRSAQDLLVNFETDTTALERVVSALEKGSEAAQKSQNPPHPLPEWQSVKKLWEQAIALLQGVPQSSPVYPLAQRKLKEYQHNLAATNQRLTIEQKAQQEVVKARSTAELASTRENIAVSLTDWQLAYATWQTVVYQLQKVPKTTMAYAEAQQLLEIYQTKLVKVGDRHTQEEIAQNAYNQAIALADQAHRSEQNDQWTQAVDAWQEALTHIQQIPQGSSYYQQVQTLTVSYRTSLTTAQEHLRVAVAVQLVENDLNSACSGMTPICRYMLAGNIVRISVTSDYEQAVKQIMFYAQPEAGTSFEVIARSNFLLRAIANISETAQLPIEFYDSNGAIMGKYDPQLSGYVRQ
jgi:tetratricopeptide (TPR) repeat protein